MCKAAWACIITAIVLPSIALIVAVTAPAQGHALSLSPAREIAHTGSHRTGGGGPPSTPVESPPSDPLRTPQAARHATSATSSGGSLLYLPPQ